MGNYEACSCENCGRTTEYVQVNLVTIERHSANLCLACAHVLSMPPQQERFFKLVRKKDVKESNEEMQKAHRLLSSLISVGTVFIAGIVLAMGVSQGFDVVNLLPSASSIIANQEPLTFIQLKSLS